MLLISALRLTFVVLFLVLLAAATVDSAESLEFLKLYESLRDPSHIVVKAKQNLLRSKESRLQGCDSLSKVVRSAARKSFKAWSQKLSQRRVCSQRSAKAGRSQRRGRKAPPKPPPPRLVAVGDLHGDYENALASLQLTGVIDGSGHWVGGKTILIQTGDVVDRGQDSLRLLRMMRRLKQEAQKAGGRVVCLMGNHELMNLQRQYVYVHPAELAKVGPAKWGKLFALDGKYGRELLQLPVAVVEGEGSCRTLFVHAGLQPQFAQQGLASLNAAMAAAIAKDVAQGGDVVQNQLLDDFGPVWYRGFAWEPEDKGFAAQACPLVKKTLQLVNATRMVTGHTPQLNGISTRCGGSLVIIDTGISKEYYGKQSAWECKPEGSTWVYGGTKPKQIAAAIRLMDVPMSGHSDM